MTGVRLTLIADDQNLASSLHNHLKAALGIPVYQASFQTIHSHPGFDSEGLLLLAAAALKDHESIIRIVQTVYLRKLPPVVILLEGSCLPPEHNLSQLDSFVSRRLRWPEQSETLTRLIRERLGHVRWFPDPGPDTVEKVISRRLLGQTPSLLPLVERIAIASVHDVTVMLTGETGTGKTHLARLMHECSPRKSAPFIHIPCGAQPPTLIESAFFGHVRGAFTGADRNKVGKFEAAGNGTILLDEIDTLGMEQQAGLLRVIETGEFEPVGSNETRHCLARIIVASNWDLEEAVRQGKFRQDLYYRLNVMSFHLPPLRERVQDIAPLTRALTASFNARYHKDLFDIHARVLDVLESHPWPGNIRQLENVVQQAVLLGSGPELRVEHLPAQVREHTVIPDVTTRAAATRPDSLLRSREMTERTVIQRALASNNYSRARAARALNISRVTLYKKMKKYGLMEIPLKPGNS